MAPIKGNSISISKIGPTTKRPQPAPKSKEYVSDSGSQEQSESESESGNESHAGDTTKSVHKSRRTASSVSSSGSEKGHDESQSSVAHSEAQVSEVPPPAKTPPKSQSVTPFEPPYGFQKTSLASTSTCPALKLLTPAALVGKQIWHITAPRTVPIRSVKEVALESVQKGEAILKHEGADYGFVMDDFDGPTRPKLLVPSRNHDGYEQVQSDITQQIYLQQIIPLPDVNNRQPQSTARLRVGHHSSTPSTKAPRAQPQGLRMRFLPIGFGKVQAGPIGSSATSADNSDEDDSQPQVMVSKGSSPMLHSGTRKGAASNGIKRRLKGSPKESPSLNGPPNKKSKHRHHHAEDARLPPSSTIGGLALGEPRSPDGSRQKRSHKGPKSGDGSAISSSSMSNVAKERKESSIELVDGEGSHRKKDKHKHKSSR